MPAVDFDLNKTIDYSERLWARLSERGYGAKQAGEPRESISYYKQLKGDDLRDFDRFWKAFNHKQDRNGAAMKWLQIEQRSADLRAKIIKAAGLEAARPLKDNQVRKMAQGWLSDFRWEDHIQTPKKQVSHSNERVKYLNRELFGMKKLNDLNPSPYLADQITAMEAELKKLKPCLKAI